MPLHEVKIVEIDGGQYDYLGPGYAEVWGGMDRSIQISHDHDPTAFFDWIECGEPFLVNLYNAIGGFLAQKGTERAQARAG